MSVFNSPKPLPKDAYPVLALCIGLMAFLAWNQSYWWAALTEDHFGWLTPAFALFVLYERREPLLDAWIQCGQAGSKRAEGWQVILANLAAGTGFAGGLVALIAGGIDRASGGHSIHGTFIVTAGISILILATTWFSMPVSNDYAKVCIWADARITMCSLMVFPAFVWLFSDPATCEAETRISSVFLGPLAAIVSHIFTFIGSPITREGNILLMPDHGRIGVEEACSGIRSFAACLYAGTFLGVLMLRNFWQKVLLVVAAVITALALNTLRTLFLAFWAYDHGAASIEGVVHDATGYIVLCLTIGSLFAILTCLNRYVQKPR